MFSLTVIGCHSPYPGKGGATAAYLLKAGEEKILIDCGSGALSLLQHYCAIEDISAVFLSHLHNDHIADVGVLQYAVYIPMVRGIRSEPLPLYTPKEPKNRYQRIPYKDAFAIYPIDEDTVYRRGELTVSFLRTDHPIPCYAMKFAYRNRTLVYGADSGPDTAWAAFARRADLFICEATYLESNRPEKNAGHLSAVQAAETARSLEVKSLLLTHLHPDYARSEVEAEAKRAYAGELFVAETGLRLEI